MWPPIARTGARRDERLRKCKFSNTGKREEFLLIPRVGSRMATELMEYRPWKTWAQFDKEIGKYVGQQEVDRLKQYVLLPPA